MHLLGFGATNQTSLRPDKPGGGVGFGFTILVVKHRSARTSRAGAVMISNCYPVLNRAVSC